MLPESTQRWVEPIKQWAASNRVINEVWLVGSRARGNDCPDSDLDVVVMTAMPKREAYNFFFWGDAEKLGAELTEMLGIKVHLLQGDPDLQTGEVARALHADGHRVFARTSEN